MPNSRRQTVAGEPAPLRLIHVEHRKYIGVFMANLELPYKRVPADKDKYGEGFSLNSLTNEEFHKFNSSILGLGNIEKKGTYKQGLAAFFDLEGFTDFSNQVDAHLVIADFLNRYLSWLFSAIAEEFKEGESDGRVRIWGSLPFYAKFLGDGILFLWDTDLSGGDTGINNVVKRLRNITNRYANECFPKVSKHVSKPPSRLRCGIARGQIVTVGNGHDFVGPCLNIASRLQKVSTLSFAVSRRGIDLSKMKDFILKKVELRGIGDQELIFVTKSEFEKLPTKEKRKFIDP